MQKIRVIGARVHNLKNITVAIPRDRLTVVTGVSGSGKSSLAFDTIFAEGQRRYVESLSSYARQFLQMTDKPDADSIDGLSPTISIDQKSASHNPRSTVGTVTEIHDYLRLLFARVGQPHCPDHHLPLQAQTTARVVDFLLENLQLKKVAVLAPVVIDRRGEYHDLFRELLGKGFTRARIDGDYYDLENAPLLAKTVKHTIEVVIDRLAVRPDIRQRLVESVEAAAAAAAGRIHALEMDSGEMHAFSTRHACPKCGYAPPELEPKLFSFNNPRAACKNCEGLGQETRFDPDLVVESPGLSLAGGAVRGWDRRNPYLYSMLKTLAEHYQFNLEMPFEKLTKRVRDIVLYGSGREKLEFAYEVESGDSAGKIHRTRESFEGIIPNIQRRWRETDSPHVREELAKFQNTRPCRSCGGARLSRDALAVRIGGKNIHELSSLPMDETAKFFSTLRLDASRAKIADRVAREIRLRASFLVNVGLDYLSLSRAANTLSGGESQRIRLASQVGSGLTGVTYVLDEPSIGLHQHDNARLLETLKSLRDLKNTVIVVEHDEEAIRAADYVVDMGPGAGAHGGEVVALGTPPKIAANPKSLTGQYLSGAKRIAAPARRRKPEHGELIVRGARGNNLRGVDFAFPIGLMTAVTGVSGSGKSTLVRDILSRAVARRLHGGGEEPLEHVGLDGMDLLDKMVIVDQSPIGRTPRSNPATYTGLFTPIRDLFAGLPMSRERGYSSGRFSFNVPGGRCENCQGDGVMRVEMHFLPDVFVQCEHCGGRRYNRETLEARYKGKNIHEVLYMTVEEARRFFENVPSVARRLETLEQVGLGYVRLGQSATTLSGGEAQRVKLSLELAKRETGRTLYILDEPTTGLHFHDVAMLLEVLKRLAEHGNTVVVIEHNMEVVKTADWLLDLGPRGGGGGGELVAHGPPEKVARGKGLTARHLRPILERERMLAQKEKQAAPNPKPKKKPKPKPKPAQTKPTKPKPAGVKPARTKTATKAKRRK